MDGEKKNAQRKNGTRILRGWVNYFFGLAAGAAAAFAGAAFNEAPVPEAPAPEAAAVPPAVVPAVAPPSAVAAAAFSLRIRIFRCLTFGKPSTEEASRSKEPFS